MMPGLNASLAAPAAARSVGSSSSHAAIRRRASCLDNGCASAGENSAASSPIPRSSIAGKRASKVVPESQEMQGPMKKMIHDVTAERLGLDSGSMLNATPAQAELGRGTLEIVFTSRPILL